MRPGDLPKPKQASPKGHTERPHRRHKTPEEGLEKPEGLGQRIASVPRNFFRDDSDATALNAPGLDRPRDTRFPRAGPEFPPGLWQARLHGQLIRGAVGVLGMELHRTHLQLSNGPRVPSFWLAAECRTHETYRPAFTKHPRNAGTQDTADTLSGE